MSKGRDELEKTQDQDLVDLLGDAGEQNATLLVVAGAELGRMFRLGRGTTVLGRAEGVDVVVEGAGVSRRHCEIVLIPGGNQAVLRDTSSNGTLVNGEVVKDTQVTVKDGDKIQVGTSTVFKLTYQDKVDESFQQHLYESAVRDPLTGVYNKRYLLDRLEQEWAAHIRNSRPLSLVIFDLDHFKRLNDTHGHQAGDDVLRAVASAVDGAMRREEVFARYGGEEFVILLRECGLEPARLCAERVRRVVQGVSVPCGGEPLRVTISMGVSSTAVRTVRGPEELLVWADKALYAAKHGGRDQVRVDAGDSNG